MNAPTDHYQTARWLLALARTLGPKERRFVGAMCRVEKPSASQQEWLSRIAARAEQKAKGAPHVR